TDGIPVGQFKIGELHISHRYFGRRPVRIFWLSGFIGNKSIDQKLVVKPLQGILLMNMGPQSVPTDAVKGNRFSLDNGPQWNCCLQLFGLQQSVASLIFHVKALYVDISRKSEK